MAISSSALTLGQYALMSNEPLVQAITYSLIDNGSIMAQDIPFVNKATLIASGVRFEGNLPSVNWTTINAEGTTVSATPTPFQEQAYLLRNYIDTDKVLVMDQNQIADPRGVQLEAFLKAAAYDFNDKFVNNTHTAGDKNAIVGIRARIDNGSTFGVRSENKIDGGGVDMTGSAATAATFASFTEYVDQLLWSVDSPTGAGVTLYLNDVLKRRWERFLRQFAGQGGFSQAQDQNGRTVDMYKGAQLRDPGYKADQTTRIITTTETSAGVNGSSNYTSIYAVNYGQTHLFGWQFAPLAGRDIGLMENGVIYRTMIDWVGGLYNAHTRSLGRVYDIKIS
jgi:hypothetical protein